ncbi:MAG: SEC-C domain-containing protein [Acidobacteria bacterium]|nr:SEC-C domain-containing protein [Acidobacteriota bacterium]MCI0664706.1 SEC-C domain-containing protein [Acidobacteriota bacterium]
MNIGRNDPCPCGSGKKYKKCCLPKQTEIEPTAIPTKAASSRMDDDWIAPGEIGDYGPPDLSQEFFDANPTTEMSAQDLVWNTTLRTGIVSLALDLTRKFISRGKEEARRIENTDSAVALVRIMKDNPDPLNHLLLTKRIIERAEETVPLILAELAHPQNDSFAEMAIKIIYHSEMDVADELLALVNKPIANAYALSLVCMLFGMLGYEAAIKPLWDCFHFFKEKYPHKDHMQGPLIGLYDVRRILEKPNEVSDEMLEAAEGSLKNSGLNVSSSTTRRLVEMIMRDRSIKAALVLREETNIVSKKSEDVILQLQRDIVKLAHESDDSIDASDGK